jgi:hypothetical protein
MKISLDGEEILNLSDVKKKVIMNDIDSNIFVEDMKKRLCYVLEHKYERCIDRLKNEWMPKLASRMESVPTNDEELAKIVFSQPDYKDRNAREKESVR